MDRHTHKDKLSENLHSHEKVQQQKHHNCCHNRCSQRHRFTNTNKKYTSVNLNERKNATNFAFNRTYSENQNRLILSSTRVECFLFSLSLLYFCWLVNFVLCICLYVFFFPSKSLWLVIGILWIFDKADTPVRKWW